MAKLNPGFAKAIYQQVDMSILNGDDQGIFTAPVKFNRTAYIVFGTYDQWMNFFTCDRSTITKPRFDF